MVKCVHVVYVYTHICIHTHIYRGVCRAGHCGGGCLCVRMFVSVRVSICVCVEKAYLTCNHSALRMNDPNSPSPAHP